MKGYKRFVIAFGVLLVLYVLAEVNRPKPINWTVTMSKDDKNPFGSFILYKQLPDLFPNASINSYRLPVYDQINNYKDSNTAYLLLDPNLKLSDEDMNELLNYAVIGNHVFVSSFELGKQLEDSLMLHRKMRVTMKKADTSRLGFVNPAFRNEGQYNFSHFAVDGYFSKLDTTTTIVLGTNQNKEVNFVKIPYGDGAFYIHANPVCFTNYFMLTGPNAGYTATALSYLPSGLKRIYWDEYYKKGRAGNNSPMQFFLSNTFLAWSYWIALVCILVFVLFEMKRKQRIIPVIAPLRNSTLDFVETVGKVYFNSHDNKNIALKKIHFLMEFIRTRFFLPTNHLNAEFMEMLSKKSGVPQAEIKEMMDQVNHLQLNGTVSDRALLQLSTTIDQFYKKAKQ